MTFTWRLKTRITRLGFLFLGLAAAACSGDDYYRPPFTMPGNQPAKTKSVVVVMVDGLRYTEGWGDPAKTNFPLLTRNMAKRGVINTRFYNKGGTYTSAGHANITTGNYRPLDNAGNELPAHPSFFQYWLKASGQPAHKAWIITSKDKLAVLGNTRHPDWNNLYLPSVNAGNDGKGLGSGYRPDSLTLAVSLEILKTHRPRLVLINFREPDYTAHSGNWSEYVKAIQASDKLVYQLWKFLQNDSFYSHTTALFITSDHGRHSDAVADGFASHGDDCEGCRHLCFFALGPDFEKGSISSIARQQPDLTATIAHLMGIKMNEVEGEVMTELFGRTRNKEKEKMREHERGDLRKVQSETGTLAAGNPQFATIAD